MSGRPPSTFDLTGKIAVVTGGANGIGAGIVTALAEAGATVAITDRDLPAAQQLAAALTAAGHAAHAFRIELAKDDAIVATCAEIIAQLGAPWILVNNAGLQDRQLLLDDATDEWDRQHKVNARAPYLMTREIARAMVAKGEGGRIVNIATNGLRGQIVWGHAAYASSKGALMGLNLVSAFELIEHGITANAILPGGVRTPGTQNVRGPAASGPAVRPPPLGWCEPSDIGAAVCFLASPAARRITNQALAVDGGFSVT